VIVQGRTFVEGCPLRPICPLKKPHQRLEVSIVETHRTNGKVRQEHIASLGSCFLPGNLRERERFWINCEARLTRLANRIGPDMDRLRLAVAVRIPPLTDDDRAVMDSAAWDQLEGWWGDLGESRIKRAQRSEEEAVALRHEAANAILAPLKRARAAGDWEAYRTLRDLYGGCLIGGQSLRHLVIEDDGQHTKILDDGKP
jgi:hypothetical protein